MGQAAGAAAVGAAVGAEVAGRTRARRRPSAGSRGGGAAAGGAAEENEDAADAGLAAATDRAKVSGGEGEGSWFRLYCCRVRRCWARAESCNVASAKSRSVNDSPLSLNSNRTILPTSRGSTCGV